MGYLPTLPRKYKGVIAGGFVLLAVCASFAVFGSRGVLHLRNLQHQQVRAEAVAFRLQERNRAIREHLRRLDSDDAYLEKVARERWGWIKPGEHVYRVTRGAHAD
jgi:cell division protein FtsB